MFELAQVGVMEQGTRSPAPIAMPWLHFVAVPAGIREGIRDTSCTASTIRAVARTLCRSSAPVDAYSTC